MAATAAPPQPAETALVHCDTPVDGWSKVTLVARTRSTKFARG